MTTVETTATGLAVQSAEIKAAVTTHTTVVQRVADTVGSLADSLTDSRLFELLPSVANASGTAAAAAGEARACAERTEGAVGALATGEKGRTELLGKIAEGLDGIGAGSRDAVRHAKAAVERIGALDTAVATANENIETLAGEQGTTQKAIGAERTAREHWQAATNKRLDKLGTELAAVKSAAELAKDSAERTAAAAETQAADVASIKSTVEACLAALTAIARGETKAALSGTGSGVLATAESPGAASS